MNSADQFLQSHSTEQSSLANFVWLMASRYKHNFRKVVPGRFHITEDEFYDEFIDKYIDEISKGEKFCLAEKIPNSCPLLIDIDCKSSDNERTYTKAYIETICGHYKEEIEKYYNIDNTLLEFYVFEKECPTYDKYKKVYKDGIHIICPLFSIDKKVLRDMHKNVNEKMGGDVVDTGVSMWMLYGSEKPYYDDVSSKYIISNVLKYEDDKFVEKEIPDFRNVVITCSMLYNERKELVRLVEDEVEEEKDYSVTTNEGEEGEDEVTQLVGMFSQDRADDYGEWINTGICLKNINDDYYTIWDEFSRKSSKYKRGETIKLWNGFENRCRWTIRSLHYWAKCDSPIEYNKFMENKLKDVLEESITGDDYSVAKVCYKLLKDEFVWSGEKEKWYQFDGNFWVCRESEKTFTKKLSEEVYFLYLRYKAGFEEQLIDESDEDNVNILKTKIDTIGKILGRLRTNSSKRSIKDECKQFFEDSEFKDLFDENPNIIGFKNGILDLETLRLRRGMPEDMCTKQMGINFKRFDQHDETYKYIDNFMKKIFTNEDLLAYVNRLLGSCLCGNRTEQLFHFWTGTGANGKSTLVNLIEKVMGAYAYKMPESYITSSRPKAGQTQSELVQSKGCRFISFAEPENNATIKMGFVKELTGGDTISARGLYQTKPLTFTSQSNYILQCNDLPDVPSRDGGTWRRIRVVPFESKFVDVPKEANEFKKDSRVENNLSAKTGKTKYFEAFGYYLYLQFKKYKEQNYKLNPPKEVLVASKDYQNKNDIITRFIDEMIEKIDNPKIKLRPGELTASFKQYCATELVGGLSGIPKIECLYEQITLKLGIKKQPRVGFPGLRIIQEEEEEED